MKRTRICEWESRWKICVDSKTMEESEHNFPWPPIVDLTVEVVIVPGVDTPWSNGCSLDSLWVTPDGWYEEHRMMTELGATVKQLCVSVHRMALNQEADHEKVKEKLGRATRTLEQRGMPFLMT